MTKSSVASILVFHWHGMGVSQWSTAQKSCIRHSVDMGEYGTFAHTCNTNWEVIFDMKLYYYGAFVVQHY